MVTLPNPELCAKCGERGRQTYTRKRKGYRRRRYRCPNSACDHRWSSFETVLDPRRIRVVVNTPARHVVTKSRLAKHSS